MFKDNKDTRTTLVSIVNFEHVIASWECRFENLSIDLPTHRNIRQSFHVIRTFFFVVVVKNRLLGKKNTNIIGKYSKILWIRNAKIS